MSDPAKEAFRALIISIAKNPILRIVATVILLFMGPVGWTFIALIWIMAFID